MASARPIVSLRRGGGAPWLLTESGVGVVVEPGDSGALADAVVAFLRDRAQAVRVGRHAQDVVTARYSLTRMVDQVESVYQELIQHY
jgi:glycosyltransferase involved in cell wall biosynthesis